MKSAEECAARGLINRTKGTLVVEFCDLCIFHGTMITQLQLEEPIRLEFSNNSVRRTTAQVDSLGIFYSVCTELSMFDAGINQPIPRFLSVR